MAIEWEQSGTRLPPLKKETPPLVSVASLLAIAEVHLAAADIPPRLLRNFYEGVLGLKFVSAEADALHYVHQQRQVVVAQGANLGALGLETRDFSEVLVRLRDAGIGYDLLHTDAGLTRQATLRDPAGNWIHLVETRLL
jgi:catechol 2,3-dioxygenase-like lactoylglutathione lyase family enzyme